MKKQKLLFNNDPNKPLVGFAFKIQDDPKLNQLTYMRIYQGKVKKGDALWDVQ